MMFDGPHLLYIFISLTLTVFMIYVATRYIKKQKMKDLFLKFFAALTVFLHLLPLWVGFLLGQPAIANDNMLFLIYFCNLSPRFISLKVRGTTNISRTAFAVG